MRWIPSLTRHSLSALLVAVAVISAPTPRHANAVEAPVTDDAYLKAKPTGTKTTLLVQSGDKGSSTYLKFDLSTLPNDTAGSDVAKATLVLWVSKVPTGGTVDVVAVEGSWSEETLATTTAPSVAASEETSIDVTPEMRSSFLHIDVTPLVQQWVDGVTENHGLALISDAASVVLDSKENTGTGHEPRLQIALVGGDGESVGPITSAQITDGTVTAQDIDASSVQRRVVGTCVSGSAIRVVNTDGSVGCQTVPSQSITSIVAGSGLTGGGTSGAVNIAFDTTFGDSRYARLGAVNTFTQAQSLNGDLVVGGRLGLGTAAPQTRLDIVGGEIRFTTAPGCGALCISNTLRLTPNDLRTEEGFTLDGGAGGLALVAGPNGVDIDSDGGLAVAGPFTVAGSVDILAGQVKIAPRAGANVPGGFVQALAMTVDGQIHAKTAAGSGEPLVTSGPISGIRMFDRHLCDPAVQQCCTGFGCTPNRKGWAIYPDFGSLRMFSDLAGKDLFSVSQDGEVSATSATFSDRIEAPLKLFEIDHPLDPDHKRLRHASIESSEIKNIYDGVIVLDEAGEAWVDLPTWFEALNGDFRYQLTAIGGPAPRLHVAEEVRDNRFKIAGGSPQGKVSWQVSGIRHDTWALEHPLIVEEEK